MTGQRLTLDPRGLPPERAPVAVGVSGGADSFSLLHALWQSGRPVHAYTVDHGFRAESAAEAEAVAAWCGHRDIPHRTLSWDGEKPQSGRQAAARRARYRLLWEACRADGLIHLVTAHTADDQAETVFMRLRRGSGSGLAAMRPVRSIAAGVGQPITLGRPMLALRRKTVAAYAMAHDLPVQDDPSNDDHAYERIRVRALLAALEQQDLLSVEALCRVAEERARDNAHILAALTTLADEIVCVAPDGAVRIKMPAGLPTGQAALIPALIERVQGAIGRAEAMPVSPVPQAGACATAGGVLLASEDGAIELLREPAALLGRADGAQAFAPVPVSGGQTHLFDRRFIVTIPQDIPPDTVLCVLGQRLPRDIATSTRARQRASTLPCLANANGITHLPAKAAPSIFDAFSGWQSVGTSLPLELMNFETRSLFEERFLGDVIRY
ncbi:MAG: tRNA lysidine(34) synthetase TilS [Parvularcula sp.]